MMTRKSHTLVTAAIGFCLPLLCLTACVDKQLEPAEVEILDRIRHYYPVVQGELLGVTYEIENTSDNPLFIQEVQTTCGCIVPSDDLPIVILPKRVGYLRLNYNTIKNSGYVHHYVWCYGNIADSTYRELQFTTNVVPEADYVHDYEQLWHDQEVRKGTIRDYVDGEASEKGYYTDDGVDQRERRRKERQEEADSYAF